MGLKIRALATANKRREGKNIYMFKAFSEWAKQLQQAEFEMEKIIEKKCVNWFGLLEYFSYFQPAVVGFCTTNM